MPSIEAGNFQIKVTIVNLEDYYKNIQGMIFEVVSVKRGFTEFQLGVRYSFVGINLIFLIGYICHYRTIPKSSRIIEQSYGILLGLSLVFFNDP